MSQKSVIVAHCLVAVAIGKCSAEKLAGGFADSISALRRATLKKPERVVFLAGLETAHGCAIKKRREIFRSTVDGRGELRVRFADSNSAFVAHGL